MPRVKGGTVARARRKEVLKEAKGYFGSKHRLFKAPVPDRFKAIIKDLNRRQKKS